MRLIPVIIMLLLGANCVPDYTLGEDPSLYGAPNPPDLSTPVQLDRIVQTTVPSVDVLWVIDNSCSMLEEQELLALNYPNFMQFFIDSGLDYHVGVVSTDMDDWDQSGKLQPDPWSGIKYIDDQVAEPVPVFQRIAELGSWGSATEKGRAAAYSALETRADTDNAGFARDDAYLSVVVISDEDDYSSTSPIDLPDFINFLENDRPSSEMVSFSSIVGPPGSCPTAMEEGTEYLAVTDAVGGIAWSVCDSDWSELLEELGMQAAGLRREFFLSEIPVEDSITVWVEDQGAHVGFSPGNDWTYNRPRNSVLFATYVPTPLAEVFIEYEVLAGLQEEDDLPEDTGTAE